MARDKSTFEKMQREKNKQQKKKAKQERKKLKKVDTEDEETTEVEAGEDPDLAGLVAGPQPMNQDI